MPIELIPMCDTINLEPVLSGLPNSTIFQPMEYMKKQEWHIHGHICIYLYIWLQKDFMEVHEISKQLQASNLQDEYFYFSIFKKYYSQQKNSISSTDLDMKT